MRRRVPVWASPVQQARPVDLSHRAPRLEHRLTVEVEVPAGKRGVGGREPRVRGRVEGLNTPAGAIGPGLDVLRVAEPTGGSDQDDTSGEQAGT
jgi:hypothetical protein